MSRPDFIFADDGETPYFYTPREPDIPSGTPKWFRDEVYFEAWRLAVGAERTVNSLSRRDYLRLVALGPDDREDVLAARRLLKKDRYK